jgi:RNA polymerase sigma-70 factor (ECF subfamily)
MESRKALGEIFLVTDRGSAFDQVMAESERSKRFEQVVSESRGLIGRVAEVYERCPADREDLIQETLVALWRALPGYRGEASLKTFVIRVAHNCAVSHVARKRPSTVDIEHAADVTDDAASPADRLDASDLRDRLLAAMMRLPLGLRQAFALVLEGLSHAEAADVLGVSENNIAVRVNRARARLRELLEVEQ